MRIKILSLFVLLVFLNASLNGAQTWYAADTTIAEINIAIGFASDGDTVIVPPGTSIWAGTLAIGKNITLQGAGDTTLIIHGIPGDRTRPPMMSISLSRDLPFRMTGFKFQYGANTVKTFDGEIRVRGICHSFRMDHCTINKLYGRAVDVDGFTWGVIDHNVFITRGDHPIAVGHSLWNGGDHGHGSWADNPYWGSEKFLFIETNTFDDTSSAGTGIDSFEGARFVVRNNQLHATRVVAHGTEGQGRGAKQIEEYNNTFVFENSAKTVGQIRSGSILTHDNTYQNVTKGHVLQNFRYYHRSSHWGAPDGENLWDKTVLNGATGFFATGTHTGANGATILQDTNPSKTWWDSAGNPQTGAWTTNRFNDGGACYMVRNKTRSMGTRAGFATANDANTVTLTTLQFEDNTVMDFNRDDIYEIWKVTQALDQPGMGKSDLLVGLGTFPTGTTPYADPHQVQEACYSWSNTIVGGGAANFGTSMPAIQSGREFFNGTPKPGYTAYTYPHPLVSGEATPAPTPTPTPTPTPSTRIIVLNGNMHFGYLALGNTSTHNEAVENYGDMDLTCGSPSVTYPTGYSGPTTSFTVAPLASHNVPVTFTPAAAIEYNGTLTFNCDQTSGGNTSPVSGTGVAVQTANPARRVFVKPPGKTFKITQP